MQQPTISDYFNREAATLRPAADPGLSAVTNSVNSVPSTDVRQNFGVNCVFSVNNADTQPTTVFTNVPCATQPQSLPGYVFTPPRVFNGQTLYSRSESVFLDLDNFPLSNTADLKPAMFPAVTSYSPSVYPSAAWSLPAQAARASTATVYTSATIPSATLAHKQQQLPHPPFADTSLPAMREKDTVDHSVDSHRLNVQDLPPHTSQCSAARELLPGYASPPPVRKYPKLPAFTRDNPRTWFAFIEHLFRMHHVTSDESRFTCLVTAMYDHLNICSDIVLSPPPTDKYEYTKRAILQRLARTPEQVISDFLFTATIGDDSPSALWRDLRAHIDPAVVPDTALWPLWLLKMPIDLRLQLLPHTCLPIDDRLYLADASYRLLQARSAFAAVSPASAYPPVIRHINSSTIPGDPDKSTTDAHPPTIQVSASHRQRAVSISNNRPRPITRDSTPGRLFVVDRLSKKKFLVDTGAEASVLPRSMFIGPLIPSASPLASVDNSIIEVHGITNFTVSLADNFTPSWTFHVAKVDTPVLGIDFLRHFDISIDIAAPALLRRHAPPIPAIFARSSWDGSIAERLHSLIDYVATQSEQLDTLVSLAQVRADAAALREQNVELKNKVDTTSREIEAVRTTLAHLQSVEPRATSCRAAPPVIHRLDARHSPRQLGSTPPAAPDLGRRSETSAAPPTQPTGPEASRSETSAAPPTQPTGPEASRSETSAAPLT